MKALIDTNVILDVLCNREKFVEDSAKIFKLCEVKKIDGYVSALSIPNLVYILRKELDAEKTEKIIKYLSAIFTITELKVSDLLKAAELGFKDYEDAIQCATAVRIKAECVITRNTKDFVKSSIPVATPSEQINMFL